MASVRIEDTGLCALYCEDDKSLDFYYSKGTGSDDVANGIYSQIYTHVMGGDGQEGTGTFKGKKVTQAYWNIGTSAYTLLTTPWYSIHNDIKIINYNATKAPTSNSLAHWFEGMNVITINITKLDTSTITSFNSTFKLCPLLTTLNLSTWDTSKVTDTIEMFNGSALLKTVYVGDNWNINSVTTLKSANMFKLCTAITGGNGTTHSVTKLDRTYACVDKDDTPGYFTYKLAGELRRPQDLPEQYTLLEYIESSGTQYIDSGIIFNQNTRVDSKWNIIYKNANAGIYGARYATSNRSFSLWSINSTTLQSDYNTTKYNYNNYLNSTNIEISWNKNYRTISLSSQETFTYGTFTCPGNAYIFAVNINGNVSDSKVCGKLYYMRIYDDGKLVRDFVPVVNNQGTRGLYDFVTKTFFTNKGSGSFTGSKIDNSIDKTYYDMSYLKKQTPKSYINTGFIPNNKTRFIAKFNNINIAQEQTIFGCRTTSSSNNYTNKFLVLASASPKGLRTDWGSSATNLSTSYDYPNKNIEIDKNKNLTYFNGTLVNTATDSTWAGTCQLYIFGLNNGSSGANVPNFKGAGTKIFNCKIYDNETLVRDFVPKLHWSGIAGFYDKVNNVFYVSSGPDDFIANKKISISKTEFDYTGSVQKTVLQAGQYKLECWGAMGGYRSSADYAGKGGYSVGTIELSKETEVFVYVGGQGNTGEMISTDSIYSGGFNGGGYRYGYHGGGGASDIRIGKDDLYARVIVAGGGGSDGASNKYGMYGGGTSGGAATESYGSYGYGGTQTGFTTSTTALTIQPTTNDSSNYPGGFGFGGFGIHRSSGYGGAGGGGWYGGCGSYPDNSGDDDRGGGGGSGYIYTSSTASNYPSGCLLNESYYLADASMITGNASMASPTGSSETGHSGNGYVRITSSIEKAPEILFELTEPKVKTGEILNYSYSESVQYITLPAGQYKLECWGAQGGTYFNYIGGYGGYSIGTITLAQKTDVYIYVGGAGSSSSIDSGFNGGGTGISNGRGGGGASDIRIGQDSLYARVIVAGGGGGAGVAVGNANPAGCGGGLYGGDGYYNNTTGSYLTGYFRSGGGASQTTGGKAWSTTATGTAGSFGQGGNASGYSCGGGGGGWYGGGGAYDNDSDSDGRYGGGGSGYVYTSSTASNYPSGCLLNESYYLTDASTTAGDKNFTSPNEGSKIGNQGNGHVRITAIEVKAPSFKIKVNGEWKEASSAYVKVNGEWKEIVNRYVKVNDVWTQ